MVTFLQRKQGDFDFDFLFVLILIVDIAFDKIVGKRSYLMISHHHI